MANNNQRPEWRKNLTEFVNNCSEEIKKTKDIGVRMLSASKTNSCLHETYEEIGKLVVECLEDKSLKWEHPRLNHLIAQIKKCEEDIDRLENEMNNIKFSEENQNQNEQK